MTLVILSRNKTVRASTLHVTGIFIIQRFFWYCWHACIVRFYLSYFLYFCAQYQKNSFNISYCSFLKTKQIFFLLIVRRTMLEESLYLVFYSINQNVVCTHFMSTKLIADEPFYKHNSFSI